MSEQNTALDFWLEAMKIPSAAGPVRPSAIPFSQYNIDSRVYKNETFCLDGYHFTNCAFISCTLTTSKANFTINGCYFGSCRIEFSGNASRAIKLASLISTWTQPIRAEVQADGATTVR